jgi:hypothetical protein
MKRKIFTCQLNSCQLRYTTIGNLKDHIRDKHGNPGQYSYRCVVPGCDHVLEGNEFGTGGIVQLQAHLSSQHEWKSNYIPPEILELLDSRNSPSPSPEFAHPKPVYPISPPMDVNTIIHPFDTTMPPLEYVPITNKNISMLLTMIQPIPHPTRILGHFYLNSQSVYVSEEFMEFPNGTVKINWLNDATFWFVYEHNQKYIWILVPELQMYILLDNRVGVCSTVYRTLKNLPLTKCMNPHPNVVGVYFNLDSSPEFGTKNLFTDIAYQTIHYRDDVSPLVWINQFTFLFRHSKSKHLDQQIWLFDAFENGFRQTGNWSNSVSMCLDSLDFLHQWIHVDEKPAPVSAFETMSFISDSSSYPNHVASTY